MFIRYANVECPTFSDHYEWIIRGYHINHLTWFEQFIPEPSDCIWIVPGTNSEGE